MGLAGKLAKTTDAGKSLFFICLAALVFCPNIFAQQSVANSTATLVENLKNKNPDIRKNSAERLGKMGTSAKNAVPALAGLLSDPAVKVRMKAAKALGKIGPDAIDAVSALIISFLDSNSDVRTQVVQTLSEIGADAVPKLVQVIGDASFDVRSRSLAIQAISEMGPKAGDAVPTLVKILKYDSQFLRCKAAAALGRIGPAAKDAVPALTEVLKEPESDVRKNAAILSPKLLKNSKSSLQQNAAWALGKIGKAASSAAPVLAETAEKEGDESGNIEASRALRRIHAPEATINFGKADKGRVRFSAGWLLSIPLGDFKNVTGIGVGSSVQCGYRFSRYFETGADFTYESMGSVSSMNMSENDTWNTYATLKTINNYSIATPAAYLRGIIPLGDSPGFRFGVYIELAQGVSWFHKKGVATTSSYNSSPRLGLEYGYSRLRGNLAIRLDYGAATRIMPQLNLSILF